MSSETTRSKTENRIAKAAFIRLSPSLIITAWLLELTGGVHYPLRLHSLLLAVARLLGVLRFTRSVQRAFIFA
jgi:hypothetical protein